MPEVREERTGWRDEALSRRHREWGWDCPMLDIDFLVVEYDSGKAIALIEYKHEMSPEQRSSHPSYQALIDLGNKAGMPVFAVRYAEDFSWWRIVPLNSEARGVTEVTTLTEREYVALLYKLRGRFIPLEVLERLGRE